jgi:hypothetical protein
MGRNIALGNMMAMGLSFYFHNSLIMAFIHGIFGWFYVLYVAVKMGVI